MWWKMAWRVGLVQLTCVPKYLQDAFISVGSKVQSFGGAAGCERSVRYSVLSSGFQGLGLSKKCAKEVISHGKA